MPILLATTDFAAGEYQIAQTAEDTALLQTYIDKHETSLIRRILGKELGDLFIANIADGSGRYYDIKQPFFEQEDGDGYVYESKGMKDALMGLIYCLFVSENQVRHTQSGVTLQSSEVSSTLSPENAALKGDYAWNDGVTSIQAIQWYCGVEHSDVYTEYAGTFFRYKFNQLL